MTEAELLDSINRAVSLGQMTQDEAQAKWLAWLMNNKSDGSEVPYFLKSPGMDVTGSQFDLSKPFDPNAPAINPIDVATAPQQQLQLLDTPEAATELEHRKNLSNMTFLEQLQDPESMGRFGSAILKGPGQMYNGIVNGIPLIAGKVIGNEEMVKRNAEDFADVNDQINKNFGTGDALTPLESLGENILPSIVPGGLGVKASMLGLNYTVDQTVRELTDDKNSEYKTTFDRLNLSGADEAPSITEGEAIAGGISAGILGAVLINPRAASLLKTSNLTGKAFAAANTPPKIRLMTDFDRLAPPGLSTVEKSSDALTMQFVDDQKALSNILNRAGIPNPEQTEKLITLNSGAAARTRITGAMVSGKLDANGVQYNSSVPVQRIVDGANALDPQARAAIDRYINLHDMVDDARIKLAQGAGNVANHATNIASKLAEASRILQQYPQAAFFKNAYVTATSALLDMMDGKAISNAEAMWLRANRPNYVPIDISPVNKADPFFMRLRQAQKAGDGNPEDWFLMKRESEGNYDINMRNDSFVVLQNYTENVLNYIMNNEVRKNIVESLQNNQYGKTFVEEITAATKNVEANQHRIIEFIDNGVKKQYLTMAETAGIARFDPYAVKYPWIYLPKRALEKTLTSALTVFTGPFANKSLMRDMYSAAILPPKDMKGFAHPGNVLLAIPKQFWTVTKKQMADQIRAGVDSANSVIPEWLWDGQSRLNWADKVSNQYVNSLYHMLNEGGGFDASMNKAHYQYAKSAIGELKRTVVEAEFWQNPAFANVVSKLGINGTKQVVSWMTNLYHASMDAARYATAEKMVKQGFAYDDAAIASKKIAGDTSRTGRVYNSQGMILPDSVDQGMLNVMLKGTGTGATILREGGTFYNPTVQGMRSFLNRFKDNPAGTMMRVGVFAQLPAMAALSWNEVLGPEYNDYAFNGRSADDVARTVYIGIPGRPPEEGIEWYVQQEYMLFNSPYSYALHGLMRGDDSGQISDGMQVLLRAIASNSTDMSMFPSVKIGMNYFGFDSYSSLSQSFGSGYDIQEDDKGFLPQNLENMARNLGGNFAKNGLELMYILGNEDGPADKFDEFLQMTYENYMTNTATAKELSGSKMANAKYSIPGQIAYEKKAAIIKFDEQYKKFLDPEYLNADGLNTINQKGKYSPIPGLPPEVAANNIDENGDVIHPDLPHVLPGPVVGNKPTNPFFPVFGDLLVGEAKNNQIGMSGLDDRLSAYDKMTKQLKSYNAGDRTALKEFQDMLNNTKLKDQTSIDLKGIIDDFKIDLTKYPDRVKLINLIENEKTFIYQQKLELYSIVESKIDKALKDNGLLSGDKSFKIENDLDPYDSNPLGIDEEMIKGVMPKLAESLATP